jgi:hypothetical protein
VTDNTYTGRIADEEQHEAESNMKIGNSIYTLVRFETIEQLGMHQVSRTIIVSQLIVQTESHTTTCTNGSPASEHTHTIPALTTTFNKFMSTHTLSETYASVNH